MDGVSYTPDALIIGAAQALRPAIIYCNAFGDHLMVRPTILALSKFFGPKLGYLGLHKHSEIFFPDVTFRSVRDIYFRDSPAFGHHFDVDEVLAVDDFDLIINLNIWNNKDTDALANKLGKGKFIALHKSYGLIQAPPEGRNLSIHTFEMAKIFLPEANFLQYSYLPPRPAQAIKLASMIRERLAQFPKLLCIHTETMDKKQWTEAGYRFVLDRFLEANEDFCVIVVNKHDSGLDEGKFFDRIMSLEGADLATCIEIVSKANLFFGVDSFFLHVADFARIPSVGLFAYTDPTRWGFCVTPTFRHLKADVMENISPEAALTALLEVHSSSAS